MELSNPSLHKHRYHTAPILVLKGFGIVGDIELDGFSSEVVLELDPLLEAHVSHGLLVLSVDKKLLYVS
jgi:hypothetical protein